MNRIAVYRSYHVKKGELVGNALHVWNGTAETAECKRYEGNLDERQNKARNHIATRMCLCGIHGYFSPAKLVGEIEYQERAIARAVLGGVVDVHSEGARGEFAVIEEMWSPPWFEDWLRKKYNVPVNRTPWEGQPLIAPALDDGVEVILGEPSPAEREAAAAVGSLIKTAATYFGKGMALPFPRMVPPMAMAMGRASVGVSARNRRTCQCSICTAIGTVRGKGMPFPVPMTSRQAKLRKDGRMWLTLSDVFSDNLEHKRSEIIDYWHARQDGYRRMGREQSRCARCCRPAEETYTHVCKARQLDRGSGVRELLLRLRRDKLIEHTRHGWWQITQAGNSVLANDGSFVTTIWRY